MKDAWTCIQMALSEVAACRDGRHAGENIEWVMAALTVIQSFGPMDLSSEEATHFVLDVLRGKRGVESAVYALFHCTN